METVRSVGAVSQGVRGAGLVVAWLLAGWPAGFAQQGSKPGAALPVPRAPVITVTPTSSGAMVRSLSGGNASLDLGRVSYFGGVSVPGAAIRKASGSLVVSTRFALSVDCGPGSNSSTTEITAFLADPPAPRTFLIDGIGLSQMPRMLMASQPCGASTEHTLQVSVPVTAPAGPVAETVNFTVTRRDK